MRRAWLLILTLWTLGGLPTTCRAQGSDRALEDDSFTFAAFGDMPYSEDEFPLMRRQLAELEPTIPFIFHVGDIKRSTVPFREDAFSRVADELRRSRVPVFITVGDNEYNDAADPMLAWSYWQKHLANTHHHWQHGLDVHEQSVRRENVAFLHRGVIFLMVHLVGSRLHDEAEWIERIGHNAEWIEAGFARWGAQARGAVVIAHARPDAREPWRQEILKPFVNAIVSKSKQFDKPVLYIHGDGHRWIQDRPLAEAPNLMRIQVDQGGHAPPLRVQVARSGTAGELFQFDRRLTPEYLERRKAVEKPPAKSKPTIPAMP